MISFEELYPHFNPDAFHLPGEEVAGAMQPPAWQAARSAVELKGGQCPCCNQHVQVYRRQIYKRMAKCIQWLVSVYTGDWVNFKEGPVFRGGDNVKLKYWKLIVPHEEEVNLYKPTEIAIEFVANRYAIPKYAFVYDGVVRGFGDERIYIRECLDRDFSLDDLGIPVGGVNA